MLIAKSCPTKSVAAFAIPGASTLSMDFSYDAFADGCMPAIRSAEPSTAKATDAHGIGTTAMLLTSPGKCTSRPVVSVTTRSSLGTDVC